MSGELQAIGVRHGTDKSQHSFLGKTYLDIYENYFCSRRGGPIKLLEIGCKDGASLRMWKEYFHQGKIYSIDIDPESKKHEQENIKVFIGSQDSGSTVASACLDAGDFDAILDDGSHVNTLTIASFKLLWPKLKVGGIYVIEDLGCSYEALQDLHDIRNTWPGMKHNSPWVDLNNRRETMNLFFERLLEEMDHLRGEIFSIHFYARMCFIIKGAG